MVIRPYRDSDFDQVVSLFFNTIHKVNIQDYTLEEVNAWAPVKPDLQRWKASFSNKFVYIAEDKNQVVGFGELESNGHIDRFYVHHEYIGRGVGSAIYKAIESKAKELDLSRLFVEASITAKKFFEAKGFKETAFQLAVIRNVALKQYAMEKLTNFNSTSASESK